MHAANSQEAELARDELDAADVSYLVDLYWQLDEWPQRCTLIGLLRDHAGSLPATLLRAALAAPDLPGRQDEVVRAVILANSKATLTASSTTSITSTRRAGRPPLP